MFTVEKSYMTEETIKKSLFIGYLIPLNNTKDVSEEINSILQSIKEKRPQATHYCYAYILGKNQDIFKYFDDGEPSRSAGYVIYEILEKKKLSNCICIVVRYFGGTKLGIGGLSRAYRSSAINLVNMAKFIPLIDWVNLDFSCRYEDWPLIENHLKNYEILEKNFTTDVRILLSLAKEDKEDLISNLIEISKNQIVFH